MCFFVVVVSMLFTTAAASYSCASTATMTIVESIPAQMSFTAPNTTYEAWKSLVRAAKTSIDIAAFYVRLLDGNQYPPVAQGWIGKAFFQEIVAAVARGVSVRLVQNMPNADFPDNDSIALAQAGVQVRSLDW
jgi:hypothetical protein